MLFCIAVADQVVNRTVCFYFHKDCCFFKVPIKIKNCGLYLIYRLPSTSHLPLYARYCTMKLGKFIKRIIQYTTYEYCMQSKDRHG